MPVASSQYWNSLHGSNADQAIQDEEGLIKELDKKGRVFSVDKWRKLV